MSNWSANNDKSEKSDFDVNFTMELWITQMFEMPPT